MKLTATPLLVPLAAALPVILVGCSRTEEVNLEPGSMPMVAAQENVTYETDIKPIFARACFKCHGADKQKAGLRLDSREATVHGSEDGPVFELGRSETSLLVTNIARLGNEDDWMPPVDKGKPLTPEEGALIRAWIDQGAK